MSAKDATSALQTFWNPSFDPQQSVILIKPLQDRLVPASDAEMNFERGGIHVKARSSGRSMLVLPLEYSHCLELQGTGKLLRANLIETGVLFENVLDARIRLRYGLFHTSCRKEDIADLKRLGIAEEEKFAPPWSQRHPHAISSLAELPAALQSLFEQVKAVR
jgi:hypothetical protein